METSIPPHIQKFLHENIETVSQLELLCIIFKRKKDVWNADSVSRELRTNPSMALQQLSWLVQKGILKKISETSYQYGPNLADSDKTISDLYEVYREKPVAIVTMIYSKPQTRLQVFADAFKIKKD